MKEEAEEPVKPASRWTTLVLRVLDACAKRLQTWHDRIDPPSNPDDRHGGGTRKTPAPKPEQKEVVVPETSAPKPVQHPFIHRLLIVAMLVLFGGVVGMFFSYHFFSLMLESRGMVIERLQDEISQYRTEERRSNARLESYKDQNLRHATQLRHALEETEVCKSQLDAAQQQSAALKTKLDAATRIEAPPRQRNPRISAGSSSLPLKSGNCVLGPDDTSGARLAACLEKFNRR